MADAALLLEVIAGHDPARLHVDRRRRRPACVGVLDEGVEGLRVGVVARAAIEGIAPDVPPGSTAAAEALEAAGAKVDEVVGAGRSPTACRPTT